MQGLVSKAAALGHVSSALLVLAALAFFGCGDDDAGDAGSADSGMDGGAAGDGFTRPRRDGSSGDDPVPDCDRYDPNACSAGQRCQVVIRRAAGEQQFLIYSGCVETTAARSEGDPCDPWGGGYVPYRAEGLDDELYIDPCGDGLFCAADPKVRGSFTCQRACESGRFSALAVACSNAGEYCTGLGLYEEVCRPSDECDPTSRNGCGPGLGCYLRFDDTGTGVLTVCLPTSEMPIADGQNCQFYNDCNAGSSCWGPARIPPERWTEADLRCRRSCIVGEVGDEDGGAVEDGEDGGVGSCDCIGFGESGLDLSTVSSELGQCE